MTLSARHGPLCELIDADLPADELDRLGRVDALLREASVFDRSASRATLNELRLTSPELALVYKSLLAAKTLGALSLQNDLLDDTIHLVDQALQRAV